MRTTWLSFFGFMVLCAGSVANAVPFFTDGFDYPNGALTTGSGGAWVSHSGIPDQIQVVDGEAVLFSRLGGTAGMTQTPIDEDVNRAAGSTLAPGSTWYYAANFTIDDNRTTPGTGTLGTTYFMHFKDSGIFNLRGRLYVTPGTTPNSFKLGVTSSSGTLQPASTWASDLVFGQEYSVVVSYNASINDPRATISDGGNPPMQIPNPGFTGPLTGTDGHSSLWVNPTNSSSTKVTDTAPNENVGTDLLEPMNSLALRQGDTGTQAGSPPTGPASVKFNINTVSIGSNFDEVLAAVSAAPAEDADFDGDGDVDGDDFLTWQEGLGAVGTGTLATGDANGDTDIDGDDLGIWEAQFATAVPAIGAVPEPACLTLAALGLVAAVAVGRRRGC